MAIKARAEITLSSIRDIQSVTRYYLLQSSTSTAPAKPTKNPPGGDWVTSEPSYTSGSTNSLYFVDLTVFSDGAFAYSDVSLSSSYEAAKVAYNKAASAEDVANSASDKVDNIEVGGRNLLPGTKTFSNWFVNCPDNMTFHDGIADIANTTSLHWRWMGSPSIKFSDVEGKDITVSMDIRSDDYEELATQTYPFVSLFLKNRGPEACNYSYRVRSTPYFRLSNKVTSEWTRVSFTHNNISVDTFTNEYAQGDAPWLSLGFWFYTKNSFQVRNIKMETGNIPTDWTEAPEDIEADISAANALAQSANGKNTNTYTTKNSSGVITYPANAVAGDQLFVAEYGSTVYTTLYRFNGTSWENTQIGGMAVTQLDAGNVVSGTMSANRIKGDTLTLGGANNVDGMLKVYDANGTLVGSFTREGLMAIAGTIGGWTIGATQLYNTYLEDDAIQHSAAFSPTDELQFSVSDNGTGTTMLDVHDRTAIYGSNGINFAVRTLDDEWYQSYVAPRGDDYGVRIGPALDVYGPLSSSSMKSSSLELQTNMGSYVRQPAMIMSGSTTISTGTSSKRATICTIPVEYQTGWRIIPFVTRTYGNPGSTPADAGDFYYAYYNSVDHNVCIKLANVLTSGIPYVFDYMIYAVPES